MRYGVALTAAGLAVLVITFVSATSQHAPLAETASAIIGYDSEGNPDIVDIPAASPSYYEYVPDGADPCSEDDLTCDVYYGGPSYDTAYTYSYPTYTPAPAPWYSTVLPGFNSVIVPIAQPLAQPAPAKSPAPSCAISANPGTVQYGGSTVLRWSSYGAQNAELTSLGIVNTSGSWQFDNLTATKTYVLALSGQGGTGNCSTVVTVLPKPQPQQQTQAQYPQPAQISAQGSGTQLYAVPASIYQTPTYTSSYNSGSYIPTCMITATPSVVIPGQPVMLSWSSNGLRGTITDVTGLVAPTGYTTITPNVSHPIVFAVSSKYGTNQCSTYVTVSQPIPTTLTQTPIYR